VCTKAVLFYYSICIAPLQERLAFANRAKENPKEKRAKNKKGGKECVSLPPFDFIREGG
jgi:hypothetical protein